MLLSPSLNIIFVNQSLWLQIVGWIEEYALTYLNIFKSAIHVSTKETLTFPPNPGKSSAGQHFLWLCQEDEKHSMVLFPTHAEPAGPFHRSHGKLLLKQTPLQLDAQSSFSLNRCQTLCCEKIVAALITHSDCSLLSSRYCSYDYQHMTF